MGQTEIGGKMKDRLSKFIICLLFTPILMFVALTILFLIPLLPVVALIRPDLIKIGDTK